MMATVIMIMVLIMTKMVMTMVILLLLLFFAAVSDVDDDGDNASLQPINVMFISATTVCGLSAGKNKEKQRLKCFIWLMVCFSVLSIRFLRLL